MKLANMHLVTGYAGYEHVTAVDQGAFNIAMLGSEQWVINKGNKLAASIVTNNQIRVQDGEIYMQGRFIRLNPGEYVDLAIENGKSGYLRNDLIVARYTKSTESGVEEVNLAVIKGTAVTSNPKDPTYTSGDIIEGKAKKNEMPLYRVPLDGLNVQELVPLFTVKSWLIPTAAAEVGASSLTDRGTNIPDNSDLDDYTTPGDYYVLNKANARTINNAPPSESGFRLEVKRGNQATSHIFQTAYASDSRVFRREKFSGAWDLKWSLVYDTEHPPTAEEVGARPADWMPTAAEVGARPADWMPTAADVGAVGLEGEEPNAMSGDLYITKGTPRVILTNTSSSNGGEVRFSNTSNGAVMQAKSANEAVYRQLRLYNTQGKAAGAVKDILQIYSNVTGETSQSVLHTGNLTEHGVYHTGNKPNAEDVGAAPAYTYGTEDINAGSASTEPNGTLHFVIE